MAAGTDETSGLRSSVQFVLRRMGIAQDWVGVFNTQQGDQAITPIDFDHSCAGGSTVPDILDGVNAFAGAWQGYASRSLENQLRHFNADGGLRLFAYTGFGNGDFNQAVTREHVIAMDAVLERFAPDAVVVFGITGTHRRSGEEGYTDGGWQNKRAGVLEAIKELQAKGRPVVYAPSVELTESCIRYEVRAAKDGVHLNRWAQATVGGPAFYQALGFGTADECIAMLEECAEYRPVVEAISNRNTAWTVNPDFYDPVGRLAVLRSIRVFGTAGGSVTITRGATTVWQSGATSTNLPQIILDDLAQPITTGEQVTITPSGGAIFDARVSLHNVLPLDALEIGD
ncbi:MAG: hypothetical protein ABFD60_04395 [Bryobacteraceae bacterium]